MDRSWKPGRPISSSPSWQRGSRGRGSSRGQGRNASRAKNDVSTDLLEPMGKLLHTIDPDKIKTSLPKDVNPAIEHPEYLTSYNWLDGEESTILVPGSPPIWSPPSRAPKLHQDNGIYFRDPNAARYPQFPVEPAVRALLESRPDLDSSAVDVVGCGNTFGSLLSACRLSDERTFVFGVERVGNTLFLVRQTRSDERIEDVRGYGHSFPEAYTTWPQDVKGSASHQRLIRYNFVGLRCVVRSETDGYLPDKVSSTENSKPHHLDKTSIEDATKSLTVSHSVNTTGSKLFVRSAGPRIPQEAIFDLKTRSIKREVDLDEFLPRLWVNQTPNFIIARHDSGVFEAQNILIKNMVPDVLRWQDANRDVLLRLQGVLRKLREITSQVGNSRVQVHRVGTGPLHIAEPLREWTVLPSELKARWEGRDASDGQEIEDSVSGSSSSDDEDSDYLKF